MRILLPLLLASASPFAAAQAHNPWIKPSAASVAGAENWVTFDAGVSTDPYVADHQPLRLEQLRAYDPDGSELKLENAATGRYRSTFDLHLTKPGTYRVAGGFGGGGLQGSYMLNGELHRVGGRGGPPPGAQPGGQARPARAERISGAAGGGEPARQPRIESGGADFALPAGATEVKLTETSSRNEVFVTLGKPSEVKPTGKGLELQPITHPADLVSDEPGRFRFLVDGKPATGLAVKLVPDGRPFRDDTGEIELKTDAKGEIAVKWPAPGFYWLSASMTDDHPANPVATQRRLSYVTTLEVMAP